MCRIIVLGVPRRADLNAVGDALQCAVVPVVVPRLRDLLTRAGAQAITRKRGCDCGSELGTRSRSAPHSEGAPDERRRLVRKGWSEAKIGRWEEERARTQARKRRDQASHHETGESAADWQRRLERLRELGLAPTALLLTERDHLSAPGPQVGDVVHRLLGPGTLSDLQQLPSDTLTWFGDKVPGAA